MAGMSSRFFSAGYTEPKYALRAFGDTLFAHSLRSFERYFQDTPFLFITLAQFDAAAFVREQCSRLGIAEARIVMLEEPTRGQAETVFLGLEASNADRQPITIFNIDTAEPGFTHPDFGADCDGYLDVFIGTGDNWSFVRPAGPGSNRVIETAEKHPISNLCSTGLYHFASSADFAAAYRGQLKAGTAGLARGEIYVAPIYNFLIREGKDIRYRIIERSDVIFFGTPAEYESLLHEPMSPFRGTGAGAAGTDDR